MILKGNQRGGSRDMALHLLNELDNDHVTVHEVSGFVAEDALGAFNEMYAISKGTKAKQFMYSLSLSPPAHEIVSTEEFEKAIEQIEKKLNLENQPRVIVFHEKDSRRHAHCVWSRIDVEQMKAINLSHDRLKLQDISRQIFLENNWKLPEGLQQRGKANSLNYTFAEYQQAKRQGKSAANIKQDLIECWNLSDDRKSFEAALSESGYFLAQGRKAHIVIDLNGNEFALTRKLPQNKAEIIEKIGMNESLPKAARVHTDIAEKQQSLLFQYLDELKSHHLEQRKPQNLHRNNLLKSQKRERSSLEIQLEQRWQLEEQSRNVKVRKGFKGLWDKISGRYWEIRRQNEREAWLCYKRDQNQRDNLVHKHLEEQKDIQMKISYLEDKQNQEKAALIRDFSRSERSQNETSAKQNDREVVFERSVDMEM